MLLMLVFMLAGLYVSATTNYNIVGVYHDAKVKHPDTWRVITDDNRVGSHKMTLQPAQVREKRYEVKTTRVADNVYLIECKTLLAKLYIEVEDCAVEANKTDALMVIENIRGKIKGRLIFEK